MYNDEDHLVECDKCGSDKNTYFNEIVEETICTQCDTALTIAQWIKKKPSLAEKF